MNQYYLLNSGTPFLAIVSAAEAAELFDSTPAEQRSGSVANGFEYWVYARNGMNQRFKYTTRATPIPPEQLPEVCEQVGKITTLPEGLAQCL
jgi:hypothetical protein